MNNLYAEERLKKTMILKLRMLLLMAVFFCTLVLAPVASAHTTQAQAPAQAQHVQTQFDYDRGWNSGYRDTIHACILGRNYSTRSLVPRERLDDYTRGYFDGTDAALKYSRACRPSHR